VRTFAWIRCAWRLEDAARVAASRCFSLPGRCVADLDQVGGIRDARPDRGFQDDHHIERELYAHLHWLVPWTSRGRAATLEYGDAEAKLLVTTYLPGQLMLGSAHGDDPPAYRQAGELLALLHAQAVVTDDGYEMRENQKALAWLSGSHRITPLVVALLRAQIAAWPTPPATLTPTHGDWQRTWNGTAPELQPTIATPPGRHAGLLGIDGQRPRGGHQARTLYARTAKVWKAHAA
jgi:hypothetical protein